MTARAGESGCVVHAGGARGLDIRLAGHSRPVNTDIPMVTGMSLTAVVPCDRRGVRLMLQRVLRQR